jgi:hypothetical protein
VQSAKHLTDDKETEMFQGLAFVHLAETRHADHMRALEEATRHGRLTRRGQRRAASRFRRHHRPAGSSVEVAA